MNFFTFSGIALTITSFLTGIIVIVQDHSKKLTRLWFGFCLTVMFFGIAIYDGLGNPNGDKILTYYQSFVFILSLNSVIFLHFIKELIRNIENKQEQVVKKSDKQILNFFYVISSSFILLNLIDSLQITSKPFFVSLLAKYDLQNITFLQQDSIGIVAFFIYYFATIFLSLFLICKTFWQNKYRQKQSMLVIISIITWVLGVLSTLVPTYSFSSYSSLLLSLSVITISYTIIYYHTTDPSYAVRKSIIYSILTLIIVLIFTVTNYLEQKLPILVAEKYNTIFLIILSFIVVIFIKPAQEYLIKLTNKIFSKKVYDYNKALGEISKAVASSIEYSEILNQITKFATEIIGTNNIILMVYNKEKYVFFEVTKKKNGWLFKMKDPLIRLLKKIQTPVLMEDIKSWQTSEEIKQKLHTINISKPDLETIKQILNKRNIAGILPLITKQKLIGFLGIGQKTNRETYNPNDIKILNTVSNQLATAIENATLYQNLKETEQATRDQHEKTHAIITNLTDGLIMIDENDNITMANPAATNFFPNNRLVGQTQLDILKPKDDKGNASTNNDSEDFEVVIEKPRKKILQISTMKLSNQKGKQIGYLKILHDITRTKEIDKVKSDFVRTAAHKLRTPLSATKWILKMMVDGDIGEISQEQKEFLQKGYQSNERMISVVNELLNVSEIEEGKFIFRFQKIQITDIIDETLKELTVLSNEKDQKINYSKDRYIAQINGDAEKIKLVIKALILNSIQYTNKAGKIDIKLENLEKELKFSITDNGVGIPEEQQTKVFTKFMRGDNITQMETEGNGLALYIAKNIIDAHKGKIGFTSKINKGTTFYFSIPVPRE